MWEWSLGRWNVTFSGFSRSRDKRKSGRAKYGVGSVSRNTKKRQNESVSMTTATSTSAPSLLLRLSILTESLVQASWNDEDKSSLVLSDAFNKTIRCSLMHEPALLCREHLIALGNLAQINDKSKKNKGKESISCLFLWPSCPTSFACVE